MRWKSGWKRRSSRAWPWTTPRPRSRSIEVPDRPGIAAALFKAVAAQGVDVDMIVQNVSHAGKTDLSFTVPRADVPKIAAALDGISHEVGAVHHSVDDDIAKVSLVGAGMKNHPGVAADMFDALAAEGINIEMISTSPIRVSCVVRAADGERAARAIHERFDLSNEVHGSEG